MSASFYDWVSVARSNSGMLPGLTLDGAVMGPEMRKAFSGLSNREKERTDQVDQANGEAALCVSRPESRPAMTSPQYA